MEENPENINIKTANHRFENLVQSSKSILKAVLIAALIRWGTFENYKIPTPSMEGTLLAGDVVAVSKLHFGPRFPITPLQIPLTHKKIWGTNIKSYSELIKLPYFRLPGFSRIKRGDKIVFNCPIEFESPLDLKEYWIKRCVGLPGETLEIIDSKVYINKKLYHDPEKVQYKYTLISSTSLDDKFFESHGINEYHQDTNYLYTIYTNNDTVKQLSKLDSIVSITKELMPEGESLSIFYGYPCFDWNTDNFGPIKIPCKGMTIDINKENLCLYKDVILHYEGNKNVKIENDILYIKDKETKSYTFKKNYYFGMGDNRHNSRDSRFLGFIPEDHILGKAVMVLFSIDKNKKKSIFKRFRWNRLFISC